MFAEGKNEVPLGSERAGEEAPAGFIFSLWSLVASLLALAACGGSGVGEGGSGGAGASGGSIAIQDLGSRNSDAACSRSVRCGLYPDQATCVAAAPPILGQLMADVEAGKVKYDGVAAADCLNALAAESCTLSGARLFKYPAACRKAFQGTVAAGAPCFINQECVSASCNLPPTAGGPTCIAGTCDAVVAPSALGEGCTLATQEPPCVDGTECRAAPGGTNMTCQSLVALGGACVTEQDCADGAGCGGTCQRYPSEGQRCSDQLPCDSSADICDSTSFTCVRRIGLGGTCPKGENCVGYATCDPASMKCVARSYAGMPGPVPPICP